MNVLILKNYSFIFFMTICLCCVGCSSVNHYSYHSDQYHNFNSSEQVLGLPVLYCGVTPTGDCITENERIIDEALSDIWKSQYIPISQSNKKEYKILINELISNLTENPDIKSDLILKSREELFGNIIKTSGCRYATLPRIIKHDMTSQMTLNMGYAIPLGVTIIFGNFPLPLDIKKENLPVYTLSLIDMQEKRIIAEEVLGEKIDIDENSIEYPESLLTDIAYNSK